MREHIIQGILSFGCGCSHHDLQSRVFLETYLVGVQIIIRLDREVVPGVARTPRVAVPVHGISVRDRARGISSADELPLHGFRVAPTLDRGFQHGRSVPGRGDRTGGIALRGYSQRTRARPSNRGVRITYGECRGGTYLVRASGDGDRVMGEKEVEDVGGFYSQRMISGRRTSFC